ncbi:MAG: NAD-dependent epimerase/dehydratase family protein [Anaerolineae bacterium]|nr:NAD-dependent epimerase/dehydratase family protein [Anaerolineae bacterium]
MNIDNVFAGRKALITGGLGFVGSNLAIRLVELGAKVMLIDSLIPDYGGNLFNIESIRDQIEINIADVRDIHSMRYLVQNRDYLFNLAGQVSHTDSMTDPFTDLEINVRAQLAIVESCRYYNPEIRIIHAATRQQYGRPLYLPVDENHLVQPTDVNGIHKTAGEMYQMVYTRVYGLHSTSLRLTNIYGPRQLLKHNRQGFIAWFIRQALEGGEIKLYDGGEQVRDMVYIEDVIEAMLLTAASDKAIGEIFNVGGLRPISIKEIADTLIDLTGRVSCHDEPFPEHLKVIDIGDFYTDSGKISNALGWKPKVDLREGLEKTLQYYEKHKEHYL